MSSKKSGFAKMDHDASQLEEHKSDCKCHDGKGCKCAEKKEHCTCHQN